jgi:hypothetical protein
LNSVDRDAEKCSDGGDKPDCCVIEQDRNWITRVVAYQSDVNGIFVLAQNPGALGEYVAAGMKSYAGASFVLAMEKLQSVVVTNLLPAFGFEREGGIAILEVKDFAFG